MDKSAVLVNLVEKFHFDFNSIRGLPLVFSVPWKSQMPLLRRPCNLMPGLADFYCRALVPHFMCGPFDFNNTPHSGVGSSCPGTKLMTSLSSGSGFERRCNQQR